ncbi:MAG: diacylglycerol kinase family protein [Acidimicrobiales bacterium]
MAGVPEDRTDVFGAVPGARRAAAGLSLLTILLTVVAGVYLLIDNLVLVIVVDLLGVLGLAATFTAVTHRGPRRALAVAIAGLSAAGVLVVFIGSQVLRGIAVVALLAIAAGYSARKALGVSSGLHVSTRPSAPPARRAVLFMNPASGGGKVEQYQLADRARALGAEVVVLEPPFDLASLARAAVADGADLLGMAGGDGSQALVAEVAAEHDLPFLCIPAGTRNHFALDLGLDRGDPGSALSALHDGVDKRIDLAFVGDRVFVNNVSLGVYAKVVQSPEYRDAKVGTFAARLPDLLGPDAAPFDLQVDGPDGVIDGPQLVQVSNNPYRFEGLTDFGVRDGLDRGVLGVVVTEVAGAAAAAELVRLAATGSPDRFDGWHQWEATELEVRSRSGHIEAGVDGEAMVLDSPLRFRSWPGAVRLRLPRARPGPPPRRVRFNRTTMVRLLRLAFQGVDPRAIEDEHATTVSATDGRG